VYKESKEKVIEASPYTDDPMIQSRIAVEKELFATKDADTVIVRPAMVYGGTQGLYTTYFHGGEQGKVSVFGTGERTVCCVHIDDLAEAYVRIVEANAVTISGQAFHFTDGLKVNYMQIAKAFSAAAGYTGVIETGTPFPFTIMDRDSWYDYEKAEKFLGWRPTRGSILEEASILYKAWKASGVAPHFVV